MFEAVIFFAGPLSTWSGRPHPREILARRTSRWRWLAEAKARSVLAQVDGGRCGLVILRDGEIIEHVPARDPACNPLAGEPLNEDTP